MNRKQKEYIRELNRKLSFEIIKKKNYETGNNPKSK